MRHTHEVPLTTAQPKLWTPKRVLITSDALWEEYGRQIVARVQALGIEIDELKNNKITGLRGKTIAETYRNAKSTLAVVAARPGQMKLQPIPPSADYQFHLAQGCPAHCQYCYLAGSLPGLPITRVYANLDEILENTKKYRKEGKATSFEASCYTDPLSLEHLTGALSKTIAFFGQQKGAMLRWVSKFDNVDGLLTIAHGGNTRTRISLNPESIVKTFEGGAAGLHQRLQALRKLALPVTHGGGGYPVGVVMAPLMPVDNWEALYEQLFMQIASYLDFGPDLTFEFITHRFTDTSREILEGWYPNTSLDLDVDTRAVKITKFGSKKYVYHKEVMVKMKSFFYQKAAEYFPNAKVLYWT
ncbi:MAG TPA: radical SAM protein [Cytophagaceae bacterium]|jgi:spore photoproduct lyase